MSLFQRIFAAEVSVSDLRNPALWLLNGFGGQQTLAGVRIDPERAMALPTYFACIRNLSEDVAKLPFKVYRRLEPQGKEPVPSHPVYRILHDAPNPEMTAMTFRELLTQWQLGWGNGYAEIARNSGTGAVQAMYPIHPSRVTVLHESDEPGSPIVYYVHNDNGATVPILRGEMFHLRGLGDELLGYSVVRLAAESLGLSLAAQTFGAAYFGNGTKIGGVLEHPGTLSEPAQTRLRETWTAMYQGPENAGKPCIAEEGMTWKPFGIPPEEAQFVETRQFQVEDVCRWLRMPPHKVGHLLRAAGWSTLEATNRDYLTDTLMPHHVRWEQECKRKLFHPTREADLFAEHVVAGMLRGDTAARSAYYREQFMIGVLSQNEIRQLENMNPIEDGDTHYVPSNMTAADGDRNEAAESPPAAERYRAAQEGVFLDVAGRMARKETNAVSRAQQRDIDNPGGYAVWADKFYARHADDLADAFSAPAMALASLLAMACGHEALPFDVGTAAGRAVREYADHYASRRARSVPQDGDSAWAAVMAAHVATLVTEAVAAELGIANEHTNDVLEA